MKSVEQALIPAACISNLPRSLSVPFLRQLSHTGIFLSLYLVLMAARQAKWNGGQEEHFWELSLTIIYRQLCLHAPQIGLMKPKCLLRFLPKLFIPTSVPADAGV